ncbi:c-type cytochrome [Thioalkalicoccus limnaeus]|uniref:C-type cytochrome n=1 Tax=Thioalkalicoccus limnaeus TaxID=120681 RepID=A0ABV4BEL7_9GAMM
MKRRTKLALYASILLFSTLNTAQAETLLSGADARTLAMTCAGCHGTDGASVGPASPTIGGMYRGYFIEIMEGFRSGEIYSTVMGRIARGYTDDEIELMADYFMSKPFVPAQQSYDRNLVPVGARLHDRYCERCHADGGIPLEDEEYFILAGQWTPYLEYAMEDFLADRRPIERRMKQELDRLMRREGPDGLQAIFAFYGSLQ